MNNLKPISHTFSFGRNKVILETAEIARQANGAVMVNIEDTVVLAAVTAAEEVKEGQDFFPLAVDYIEKFYAAGRIPGNFFKREGKQSENEILTSRLIDRPIRPLFSEGFYNEVQIVVTVLSQNPEIPADIPAMIAASAALSISGIPFNGPMGAARIGYINNEYVVNPTISELKDSSLDLVVAGSKSAVLMVESEARELSEDVMLGAVKYGHEQFQEVITAINELVKIGGKSSWQWQPTPTNNQHTDLISELAKTKLEDAYRIVNKLHRRDKIREIFNEVILEITNRELEISESDISKYFHKLEAEIVRGRILAGEPRIDGRDTRSIRPIDIRCSVLPRTHGSALFTRGETQALVVTTLGTGRDEQIIDALTGEYRDRFIFHYNMPPYATGEVGRIGPQKRREIGHGRLAKRAIIGVLPKEEDFQYSIRLVSEITESNGSSSMASVCGASLSMMDAGVPLKTHVAGIAMGLILEGNKFAVLTDILGDEDHLGDMDFKVAGTENGITALQMDIKIQGITFEIMGVALEQACSGRQHILQKMKTAINSAKSEISEYAPRMYKMKINPEKIRDIIGKGGVTIRSISEESGTNIDITDDGVVTIASASQSGADIARKRIIELTAEIEVGQIYTGSVIKLLDFGAIVGLLPGRDGLLHISQISKERVNKVEDVLSEGQEVTVKVIEADEKGRIRLSIKELLKENQQESN